MTRSRPAQLALAATVLTFTTASCRQEPVNVEELATTRTVGVGFLERGLLPEAETQFLKVVRLAPKDPLGHANLGLTYLRAGRYADAEHALRRAHTADPASVEVGLIEARLYSLTERWAEARVTLETLWRDQPRNAQVLYALAELESRDTSRVARLGYEQRLRQVLSVTPANIAVRAKLLAALVRLGQPDSVLHHLEDLSRIRPAPPVEARQPLAAAFRLLRAGKLDEARRPLDRFLHLVELTQPYQAALARVKWLEGPLVGRPVLTFKPESRLQNLRVIPTNRDTSRLRFTDVTRSAGFPDPTLATRGAPHSVTSLLTADFFGNETDDMLLSFWSPDEHRLVTRLFRVFAGEASDVTQQSGLPPGMGATVAAVGDYDNDGWLDVFALGADGRPYVLHNAGGNQLVNATATSGVTDVAGARAAQFVDLDHDGDLDLLLVGGSGSRNRVYRNNADGTFTEVGESMGLAGSGGGRDAAFADFDGDGRIDVIVATEHGPVLYRNTGARRFDDVTAASGLPAHESAQAVIVADYDNDGAFDVLLLSTNGRPPTLWRGAGDATFTPDRRADMALGHVGAATDLAARFVDVDNDGWLDLVVVGTPAAASDRGAFLFHNDGTGRFVDRSAVLPATLPSGGRIALGDIDGDGDVDLFVGNATGVRVLRNDAGSANLSVAVSLFGLRAGSGKNNNFGVGARVELRAGEIFQTRVVTDRVTRFGLGRHLKADVLRIEWPNGLPQTIYFPGTDADVMELDLLKGSCAFVYAWDGEGFRFVTDVMWRSALGMPVGIMGGTNGSPTRAAYAPAGASQEYLRISGSALKPRSGRYAIQLTEELWETAYADRLTLLAVDHPDSVDIFVDERFVPPAPVTLRHFNVARLRPPRSAIDDHGNDVLAALLTSDKHYVSQLAPLAYQGIVESHDLIMDLGNDAGHAGTFLFLRGWIFPADASINVALTQQSAISPAMPSLAVRDAAGQWVTAIPNIGFPSGKDKTVVVDLAGIFPTADRHVRIRTNLQIYWDQAFTARDAAASPVRITSLEPMSADLHVRGYSRMYRAGGRYGPHWFDYDSVTRESPWRTIEGAFTRVGDVLPLLRSADDMYVIMAPGDETTVEFAATSAGTVPHGWTRDFLLYTDGWIKDADLNTAFGNTVGPLPFHAITQYPYAPGDSYPADSAHQNYLRTYNTRVVRATGTAALARAPGGNRQ